MLMQDHDTCVMHALSFEKLYLDARNAEHRVYPDEIVRMLPACDPGHPHAEEWLQRSRSAGRLIKYLQSTPPGRVLEIGCGNGWLSHLIATNTYHTVTGSDLNAYELEQATRLFEKRNLRFMLSNGNNITAVEQSYDYILFAASIQYFDSLSSILNKSLDRLSSHGEIHILDTRIYKSGEIPEARERSRIYYQSLGHPRMISNYFHHSREELLPFRPEWLFNPASFINKLKGSTHEFPWVRISKSRQKL